MSAQQLTVFWRSPSGRLHLQRRCSGNGQPQRTVKVHPTVGELVELLDLPGDPTKYVCRCAREAVRRLVREGSE